MKEAKEWNKCPGCLTTAAGSPDYCPNCGEPWTMQCPQCSLTWRFWENHKFCPKCGTRAEHQGVNKLRKKQDGR